MADIIASFQENTQLVKDIAISAHRAMQNGTEFMYEMRHYRVRDIGFEGGALVIRGDRLRSDRHLPQFAGATFSDGGDA